MTATSPGSTRPHDGTDPAHPDLTGVGGDEDRWRRWAAVAAWPEVALPDVDTVVVVAPHPDDAVLAVGGLMRRAVAEGRAVELVAVTDGEASHPGSATTTPAALGRRRVREDRAAFAALGVPLAHEVRLGLPDGGVIGVEPELTDALVGRVGPDVLLLAPWAHDGHPDHDATGRAARDAVAATGATLWSYPVWTWHWAAPGDLAHRWQAAARLDLDPDTLTAKRRAIACHASQVHPLGPGPADAAILPPPVLARFTRPWEAVLT